MGEKTIPYKTRDSNGNDIIKQVKIKQFTSHDVSFVCPCCHKPSNTGVKLKDVASSKFTDWAYVGEYICESCTDLFSLYFYSYIVEDGKISIINVREIRDNILRQHKTPFKFIITKTGKKHLFYRCPENLSDESFAIQLENETIYTNHRRMQYLFDFVENLMSLGQSKQQMELGNINYDILSADYGERVFKTLREELSKSREIQIPLFCGQKRDISKEDAICNIISLLKM